MLRNFSVGILVLFCLSAHAESASWSERLNFSNDFRFRSEYSDQTNDADSPAVRQRLRARLGLSYDVNDTISTSLKLASGSDDPVSSNETLDGGFSTKDIRLDEVYAKWKALEDLSVYLGKTKTIFYTIGKNEILWDGDLKPEGMAARYKASWGEFDFEANASSYWVDQSNSNDEDSKEVMLNGLQARGSGPFTESFGYEVGAGIYDYSNLKGHKFLTKSGGTKSLQNGNSGTTVYSENYQIVEGFVGVRAEVKGEPLLVYYNAVNNARSSNQQNGFIAGFTFGKVKEVGDLSVRYSYRNIEDNAVLGAFTDSDFNNGKTNGKGSEIGAEYGLAKNTELGVTFFSNKTSTSGGDDYHRGQVDLLFSF